MMGESTLSRRRFVSSSLVAPLLGTLRPISRAVADEMDDRAPYRLFWGDLHNHGAVGYAKGTLERAIEIAQEHLDFFSFTGHAAWHDMPKMPGNRQQKWSNGFQVHSDHWDKTRALIQDANSDEFAAILGYEWHSSRFGDHCLLFEKDQPELYLPDHVGKLLQFARDSRALAIPHHLAYARGWRGANFDHFAADTSPVVEIFSEHGCSESVTAPVGDFIRHSMGGRVTENTVDRQLSRGLRFGMIASTDDHLGYPGAYGEGLVGIWARDLSPGSIIDALRRRRVYAVTGDRIEVDFTINDHAMGSELQQMADRQIDISINAPDGVKMVELVRSGRVIERYFPEDTAVSPAPVPGRVKCRLRYGWGPWADLSLDRVCDWEMHMRINGGRFAAALPCFQSAPFDEMRRDRLRVIDSDHLQLNSHTSRAGAYGEDPTKAVILEIEAERKDAVLSVDVRRPTEQRIAAPLANLRQDNQIHFTGGFTSECFMLERLVGPSDCQMQLRWNDRRPGKKDADWYYVRVLQHNNQMAWSSPIWVG